MVDTVNATKTHMQSSVAGPGFVVERVTINCATANRGSGDIDQLFDVYQGDYILAVVAKVTTVEDSTATFDVGFTGGDVNCWIEAQDAEVLGFARTSGAHTLAGGFPQNATDTIDAVWSAAADTAVIEFTMFKIAA